MLWMVNSWSASPTENKPSSHPGDTHAERVGRGCGQCRNVVGDGPPRRDDGYSLVAGRDQSLYLGVGWSAPLVDTRSIAGSGRQERKSGSMFILRLATLADLWP